MTARDLTLKYTGKTLKVSPVVQYNGKTLKFNKDYEIRKMIKDGAEVTEVKEEGTYTLTLSGKDGSNFCEDTDITVTVAQSVTKAAYPSIKKAVVTYGTDEAASAKLSDQNYLGTDIPVELDAEQLIVKVKDADKKDVKLENGTDYMISYQNNRKAGTAKLILTGIGDYAGSSLTKTFKIDKVTLSKEAVTDGKLVIGGMDGVFAYVKGGVKPLPKVTYQYSTGRSETLVPGKDYTLGYKKNTVRGTDTALVTIKGKGNFAGSVDKSFSIGVQSDGAAIDVQAADVVYKEKANNWKTSVVLYDTDGKKLAAGKDYDKTLSFVVVGVPSGSSVKEGLVPGAKTILPVGTTVKVDDTIKEVEELLGDVWKQKDIRIPAVVEEKQPQYTADDFRKIDSVLGQKQTQYSGTASRAQNLANGTSKISGTVLMPGEQFSVFNTVSPFTEENGYANAGQYVNDELVDGLGGGICQVSTTLYNAVLQAELQVDERYPHSLTVSYVPLGMDAAIAGDYMDFKFTNSTEYPIYIEGYAGGGSISFAIYGHETRPSNRSIYFESKTVETYEPGDPEEVEDDTLEEGKTVTETAAHTISLPASAKKACPETLKPMIPELLSRLIRISIIHYKRLMR